MKKQQQKKGSCERGVGVNEWHMTPRTVEPSIVVDRRSQWEKMTKSSSVSKKEREEKGKKRHTHRLFRSCKTTTKLLNEQKNSVQRQQMPGKRRREGLIIERSASSSWCVCKSIKYKVAKLILFSGESTKLCQMLISRFESARIDSVRCT